MKIVMGIVAALALIGGVVFFLGSNDSEKRSDVRNGLASPGNNSCQAQYENLLSKYGQSYSDCSVDVSEFDECSATPKGYQVSVVFDASGSMAGLVSGERKIDIAREEVLTAVSDLQKEGVPTGFVVYGHKGDNTEAGKSVSCNGIEEITPISTSGFGALAKTVNGLEPTGWTPIADSLEFAAGQFSSTNETEEIILVSDGLETCGGDPVAMVKKLKAQGVETVSVIGFDVSGADEAQLRSIATAGDGLYVSANSRVALQRAFDEHRQWSEKFDCQMEQFEQNLTDSLDSTFKRNDCLFRLESEESQPINLSIDLGRDGVTDQCITYIQDKYEVRYKGIQDKINNHFDKLDSKVDDEDPFGGDDFFDEDDFDWE